MRATLGWHDRGIYFAGAVQDDALMGLPEDPDRPGNPWEHDGMLLIISPTPAPLADRSRYLDRPEDVARTRNWGINYYEPGRSRRRHREPNDYVAKRTPAGYNLEALLPWETLAFSPQVGDRYRLAVILIDHNEDRRYHSGWGQALWATGPGITHNGQGYAAEI